MEDLLYWIANTPFKREEQCNCDFDGNWLGDGICIGCRHLVTFFKDDYCTYPVQRDMTAKEMKKEIIQHITELIGAGGR